MHFILASKIHPNEVITASLALFFHRANNGLFSSTLIFFLLLNKTMETTKGDVCNIAIERTCMIYAKLLCVQKLNERLKDKSKAIISSEVDDRQLKNWPNAFTTNANFVQYTLRIH